MQTNKPLIRFLIIFIVGYLILNYFVLFWIGLCAPGGFYWEFAAQHLNFIAVYRHFLLWGTGQIAGLFGIRHLSNDTSLRLVEHGGIKIVYSCLGFGIISILAAFAIAVSYQKIKQRLIFLFSAILLFSLLNMIRLFVVSYYVRQTRDMNIDHHAIFNWLCYALILIGMYWWINKTSPTKETVNENEEL